MDLVALSNGLHGSVQMDSVALFSWIGWLRHHGIFNNSGCFICFQVNLFFTLFLHYFYIIKKQQLANKNK